MFKACGINVAVAHGNCINTPYQVTAFIKQFRMADFINLTLLIDPDGWQSVDTAADNGVVAVIGIDGLALTRLGSYGHGQVFLLESVLIAIGV